MATLEDVKIHIRLSDDTIYNHCFIAESVSSLADIKDAILNRFRSIFNGFQGFPVIF